MNGADYLLFEKLYDEKPLFNSQLDLVDQLLTNPETGYFIGKDNKELYSKAQNRLKAYISQLLSASVTRNITEDFRNGLLILIAKRLQNKKNNTREIVNSIVQNLKEKNFTNQKYDSKKTSSDQFYSDLNIANYVSIVNSNPLEIELVGKDVSISKFLLNKLIESLEKTEEDIKYYRFNFPMESFCVLFWNGLKKGILNYLQAHIQSQALVQALYLKFAIKTNTFSELENKKEFDSSQLEEVTNEILELLNRNRFILTFTVQAPIFSIPLIIINPAEPKNCKVYALLDDMRLSFPGAYKYSESEAMLWRLFVWDKLKSRQYAGTEVKFSRDF